MDRNSVLVMNFVSSRIPAVFFLKGDLKNSKAIFKARKEFKRLRKDFAADRTENLRKTEVCEVTGRYPFSILWQSKVKGKKIFSKL